MDWNIDIWSHLLNHTLLFSDACITSSVNSEARRAFFFAIKCAPCKHFNPRRTFISYGICMVCEKIVKTHRFFNYSYDQYPKRIVISCHDWNCFKSVLKRFFLDVKNEGVHPFIKCSQNLIWVPRSNRKFSIGKACEKEAGFIKDEKLFVRVFFEEKYSDTNIYPCIPSGPFDLVKYIDVDSVPTLKIEDEKFMSAFSENLK